MKNYFQDIRKSFGTLKKAGTEMFLFVLLFSALRDFILEPLLGKFWGLVLSTTPDGLISNGNLVNTLLKSPWIIPAGVVMLAAYAFIALWQTSGIVTGIGYIYQGKIVRLRDLIRIAAKRTVTCFKPVNLLILLYTLVLLPFTELFSTNDVVSVIAFPEYINDFIFANTALMVLLLLLLTAAIYFVLRWFYVLPAFFLKHENFRDARMESRRLTKKKWFVNGLRLAGYSFVETVRLSIIPFAAVFIPAVIAYICTNKLQYSLNLFRSIGVNWGKNLAEMVAGTFVQISVLCFLVTDYVIRLEKNGENAEFSLPDLKGKERKQDKSVWFAQSVFCMIFSLAITCGYLVNVFYVQKNPDYILERFGKTDIIAHKGYSSKAPENTMPAFELADKSEATDYMELDVWTSKDGIPVVIHNETIKDATGIDKKIYDCTYEELQKYPAVYSMDEKKFENARIPSLEEVIVKYAASTPLLIEIKGFKQDPELPAKIVALMEKYEITDTSLVHSGDYGALKAVKKENPNIQCGLIMAMVTWNFYDIPYADFFSLEHNFVNEDTVEKLHQRGKRVYAWTVNYDDSATKIALIGVDGIITDYPDDVEEYVSDENELVKKAFLQNSIEKMNDADQKDGLSSYLEEEY